MLGGALLPIKRGPIVAERGWLLLAARAHPSPIAGAYGRALASPLAVRAEGRVGERSLAPSEVKARSHRGVVLFKDATSLRPSAVDRIHAALGWLHSHVRWAAAGRISRPPAERGSDDC